MVDMTLNDL